MASIVEMFGRALRDHQAGHLNQAEQLYLQILRIEPHHADSLHLLGVLALQRGHYEQALTSIRQALTANPTVAMYHSNLGVAQKALGQTLEARASFEEAVRLQPGLAETHHNLADVLWQLGRLDDAAAHCQEALRLRADFPEAHNNLGNVLTDQGKWEEAISHFQQALRHNPGFAEAHNGLGIVFFRQGKLDESAAEHRAALRLKPGYAEAHNNLGLALQERGRLAEAVDQFSQALRITPHRALLHHNVGCAFLAQGELTAAQASFNKALSLHPGLAAAQSNRLFCMNYDPHADPDWVFEEHRRWGENCAKCEVESAKSNAPISTSHIALRTSDVLRIGYVSPDFRFHPLTRYLEGVLANHDPRSVEVYCYAEVARPDEVTARLQKLVHGWRFTCGMSDAEVAEQIRKDGIHILVDLAGHTGNNRLRVFADRPAPLQVAWLGYLHTTGLPSMDYRLTDSVLDPVGHAPTGDAEQLFRLPSGMCCFTPPAGAPPVTAPPAQRNGHVTFGSLHGPLKINASVIELWARVLKAVPSARLVLFHDKLVATTRERICQQFLEHGVNGGRVDLREGSCAPGYLGVYREIDISLDTFPCTGGVTTCESLWMGVPMLTLCGVRPAARNSAALLTRVGLVDWVAQTAEQYVSLAVKAANDLEELGRLRSQLRDWVAANLCDAERFTRELEEAYRIMWQRWCAKASRA